MSLLRSLEYECLPSFRLEGRTLDVGGGEDTSYRSLLNVQGDLHWINIDRHVRPTVVGDLSDGLPCKSDVYDNVISLNTFEHIWNDTLLLQEIGRVLKPKGRVYLIVPFLYPVHASPSDYRRWTGDYWDQVLPKTGFAKDSVQVVPLVFGAFSTALSLVESGLPRLLKPVVRAIVLLPLWIRTGRFGLCGLGSKTPLGYFISAEKEA